MHALKLLAVLALLAAPLQASADLRVGATRIVYQEGTESAPSVRVRNIGEQPSLVQVWLDSGEREVPIEQLRMPLMVTPPIFRLEPGSNRDIQIRVADTSGLPKDRESLLWLNILDVPPRQAGSNQKPLEFAMRWRLKVFHRPSGLPGSPDIAPEALQWSVQRDAQGRAVLKASNASAYFVSLSQLILDGRPVAIDPGSAQVPPMGSWTHEVAETLPGRPQHVPLTFVWIDARGVEHSAAGDAVHAE
ncbi:fimbrial biogenesis chaperone [Stenotrophomonas beteli]|uniref:Pili assembly chaperone N-terminal domain-containing protein n=1 Tax=Stenotrophomonas beteli TaxID=3384461 RepID=A0A0R0B5H5_9GAMM|nr:fimbria/pilus periplasmic chaperone [Stenotrophomonas maltophilia]KRG52539.1 hypothetical protein ARC23_05255 [Stenotrophomonas maltophilia]